MVRLGVTYEEVSAEGLQGRACAPGHDSRTTGRSGDGELTRACKAKVERSVEAVSVGAAIRRQVRAGLDATSPGA